ncbi:hypothetical protein MHZ95_04155 [Sporosarcina sp. ACRSM]|uniref:hypothetical protein n=1 Tax=Sporosarcina sp. ACRSM TaxID=2918216 RepID=UPI001EF65752|nr:hypothetical protein [Sporosarcina sp. ACRSM]MCG7334474.1 hypothetical protein [Sporosarcina sp. ACRSM]
MYKRFAVIGLILFLYGCSSKVSVSEISLEQAEQDVLKFVDIVHDENGRYLYTDDNNQIYIFLNEKYVQRGQDAVHFTAFYITAQQDVLNVFINQDYASDYSETELKYQALYKISTLGEFDRINLFSNGEPVPFDRIFSRES